MIEESVDLEGFQLLDPAVQQCPHLYYEKMREECPVYPTEVAGVPIVLVTRYEDVLEIIKDTDTFSSETGGGAAMPVYVLHRKPHAAACALALEIRAAMK